jgi:precorrin isomerase
MGGGGGLLSKQASATHSLSAIANFNMSHGYVSQAYVELRKGPQVFINYNMVSSIDGIDQSLKYTIPHHRY